MKSVTVGLLFALVACGSASGQTDTPSNTTDLPTLTKKLDALQLFIGMLRNDLRRTAFPGSKADECKRMDADIEEYTNDVYNFIDEVNISSSPGGIEGKPRYDIYRSAYTLSLAMNNIKKANEFSCFPDAELARVLAMVYGELAETNITLSKILLEQAGK